jgi:hypothetical protein
MIAPLAPDATGHSRWPSCSSSAVSKYFLMYGRQLTQRQAPMPSQYVIVGPVLDCTGSVN